MLCTHVRGLDPSCIGPTYTMTVFLSFSMLFIIIPKEKIGEPVDEAYHIHVGVGSIFEDEGQG